MDSSLLTDIVPQGIFYLYSFIFTLLSLLYQLYSVLCSLYSVFCTLYSVSCTLNSSCQLELYRDPEVLGGCGVGRRGEEGFVELAVVICRHGDEL